MNIKVKYRFYFNFPTVNESKKKKFVVHSCECTCKKTKTNKNGFWTECYDKYEEAEKSLRRLIEKFRDSDFEIAPCKWIKN